MGAWTRRGRPRYKEDGAAPMEYAPTSLNCGGETGGEWDTFLGPESPPPTKEEEDKEQRVEALATQIQDRAKPLLEAAFPGCIVCDGRVAYTFWEVDFRDVARAALETGGDISSLLMAAIEKAKEYDGDL